MDNQVDIIHPCCCLICMWLFRFVTLFTANTILSTSHKIPTRVQYQKKLSCLLPVDSCHGTTILMSDCTIETSGHHGSVISTSNLIWWTTFISNNSTTQKTCNRKYTWLLFSYCPLVGILFEVLRIGSK